jgi:hypothetical protein
MFPSIGLPVLLSIPLLRLLKAPGSAASMPIAATD